MERQRTGNGRRWLIGALVAATVAVFAAAGAGWLLWQRNVAEFPEIDAARLDPGQAALVEVLRREYDAPGEGTKYAEGVEEAWCADFVSWTMRAAGRPLANPNSGHWRIPGVYTLTDYYIAEGRFTPASAGYRPRTGDVVLYGPGSEYGQHTNIVLTADGDSVTTIGGNELGGRVMVRTMRPADMTDLIGYGRF
ncbi:CHAP domain-containing protein [Nocardia thailandica]|uniref:CHAP domain-containing protein n=1 Tax=Nocardia thailandica TaxID=257275 RepID=UPI0002E11410|nr:CHAP domain-containing protein [Nocardia thailandica]